MKLCAGSRARGFTRALALAGICMTVGVSITQAWGAAAKKCPKTLPAPFPRHQPFLLNDPRSGLMLYVESDGRHMAAITHGGKIVWQRNLFDDPRLESVSLPPPQLSGEPRISDEQWKQHARSSVRRLYIDRIGVVSDCEMNLIVHINSRFRGHYIRAGSGTYIYYLLDAKSGDFVVEDVH